MNVRKIEQEDLVLWPDGTNCFYYELSEMGHMSDDYEVIPQDSPRYEATLSL